MNFKTNKNVFTIGDVNIDFIIPYGEAKHTTKLIKAGKYEFDHPLPQTKMYAGGSVANTASLISRLGLKVYFCGISGDDIFSQFLKEEFEKDLVDTKYFIRNQEYFTTIVFAVIDENKERFLSAWPTESASIYKLEFKDIPNDVYDELGWIHTAGTSLRENPAGKSIVKFLKTAREKDITVSLDLNLRVEEIKLEGDYYNNILNAIEYSNVIFASGAEELFPLTGMEDIDMAAKSLVREDRIVVSRLGSKGSKIYTKDKIITSPAFDVEVIDTIGAGDAANAGFIYSACKGESLEDIGRISNAVAGYSLEHIGGRSGPNEKQLNEFLKK